MDMARRSVTVLLTSALAALALAACGELPQDGPKPFVGKDEARSNAGARSEGDRALHERTLAARARTQDEYPTMANGDK